MLKRDIVATLKSYHPVYTEESYYKANVRDLVFFIWSWEQRAAIVNIFEIAEIPEAFAKARARLEISDGEP